MTAAPAPTVTPELKQVLRRLKLGKMLDTLPERLVLARGRELSHAAFLELVCADEVDRRDRTGTARRAHAARLDASMTLETWDDDTPVAYDRALWADLTTLDFVERHNGAFILGPARRVTAAGPMARSKSSATRELMSVASTSYSSQHSMGGWRPHPGG